MLCVFYCWHARQARHIVVVPQAMYFVVTHAFNAFCCCMCVLFVYNALLGCVVIVVALVLLRVMSFADG